MALLFPIARYFGGSSAASASLSSREKASDSVERRATDPQKLRRLTDVTAGPHEGIHDGFAFCPTACLPQRLGVGASRRYIDPQFGGIDLLSKFVSWTDDIGGVSERFKSFAIRYLELKKDEAEALFAFRNSLVHSFGLYNP